MKRFFKQVTVNELALPQTGYGILLDGRALRTPAKHMLAVRSSSLASAIAHEWQAQEKLILPHMMPLTTLATTSIDQMPAIRPQLEQSILIYFQSDTVCFRSPDTADTALKRAETRHWDPLIEWFNTRFGAKIERTDGLLLPVSERDVEAVESFLEEQSDEMIAALDALAVSCKSFVIAAAVTHGTLSADAACTAARVSEDAQISEWGLAEGSHDLEVEDLKIRVAAASVFAKLSAHPTLELKVDSPPAQEGLAASAHR